MRPRCRHEANHRRSCWSSRRYLSRFGLTLALCISKQRNDCLGAISEPKGEKADLNFYHSGLHVRIETTIEDEDNPFATYPSIEIYFGMLAMDNLAGGHIVR